MFFGGYLLHDRGIEKAVSSGHILVSPSITEDQLQPASLDLRIGKVKVYDLEAQAKAAEEANALSFEERIDYEPTNKFAKIYPNKEGKTIDLEPGAFAEIYFHEKIEFDPERYDVDLELRSSRGRLFLTPTRWTQRVEKDEEGWFISIRNENLNPIRLYSRDKFAQLFFYPRSSQISHDGYIVTDPKETAEIAATVSNGEFETHGPLVVFTLGDHLLKLKSHTGLIDSKNMPSSDDLFEKLDTQESIKISTNDRIITQLHPRLQLPSDIGILILNHWPYFQSGQGWIGPDLGLLFHEGHLANAGWVDPGYEGFVTGHPLRRKFSRIYEKGEPVALGQIYRYTSSVLRPYGSEKLGSHYQGSVGVSSRS